MSEIMNAVGRGSKIGRVLLGGVSAATLCTIGMSSDSAAESIDKPTVWIELGGQLERVNGTTGRFVAPFMLVDPVPDPFAKVSPIEAQRPPRYAVGGEALVKFEPSGSDWVFSAAVRYGRSNGSKHTHYQSTVPLHQSAHGKYVVMSQFADTKNPQSESHTVVDFTAGRDVGLGLLGRHGSSVLNMGIRFAQFSAKSTADIHARPTVRNLPLPGLPKYVPVQTFNVYTMFGHSERNFHGVGPSLSWAASVPVLGDPGDMEVTLDWGLNGAVLFGRQRAKIHHNTTAYHSATNARHYTRLYSPVSADHERSRSVTVPNVGGTIGISFKFPDAKVSMGYRADLFYGAMDTGNDVAKRSATSFHGPFATISVGLGG